MVAAIGAVAGVAGAAISSSGARSAANAQAGASQEAQAMQMMAQAQMRSDLAPWVDAGKSAQNQLSRYLGTGTGGNQVSSAGLGMGLTPDQVRQQLLSRYTTQQRLDAQGNAQPNPFAGTGYEGLASQLPTGTLSQAPDSVIGYTTAGAGNDEFRSPVYGTPQPQTREVIDEEGLNAAIQQYYAEQRAFEEQAKQDPLYGSLLRPYKDGADFDPGDPFSFTGQDLQNEPGYQFGLQQGELGINRANASRGSFLSGAAMRELNRFNQDYAGTKFNEGFGRALTTHNTNLTDRLNAWNTNLAAYNNNRNQIYNMLSGQSSQGQNAAAQVGNNNQQVANNVSNNLLASGNAAAAASIASGNAWQSGLNQAANALNTGNNSVGGWNLLLANQSQDPIASLNSQMKWTG